MSKPSLGLFVCAIITGAAMVIAFISWETRHRDNYTIERHQATAYACGFTSGQRATMAAMNGVFEPRGIPHELSGCIQQRLNAAKHGFNEGKLK